MDKFINWIDNHCGENVADAFASALYYFAIIMCWVLIICEAIIGIACFIGIFIIPIDALLLLLLDAFSVFGTMFTMFYFRSWGDRNGF